MNMTAKDIMRKMLEYMTERQVSACGLDLEFALSDDWGLWRYSRINHDKMIEFLFDLSLTSRITEVQYRLNFGMESAYPCIVGFKFKVERSKDFQTNITPKLMDFLGFVIGTSNLNDLMVRREPSCVSTPSGQMVFVPDFSSPLDRLIEWIEDDDEGSEPISYPFL